MFQILSIQITLIIRPKIPHKHYSFLTSFVFYRFIIDNLILKKLYN